MDNDGPQPMRGMKPAQKQRTGAEQFELDHQGEYEAHCQPSRDKVARVHEHNNVHPKMNDELNKKRSTAKPQAFSELKRSLSIDSSSYCPRCLKLIKQNRLVPKHHHFSERTRNNYERYYKTYHQISKPKNTGRQKPQRSSKLFLFKKIMTNKCCQCTSYPKPVQIRNASTCHDCVSIDPLQDTKMEDNKLNIDKLNENASSSREERRSDGSRSGDTPAPSISSYNSFVSLDHEPMVE